MTGERKTTGQSSGRSRIAAGRLEAGQYAANFGDARPGLDRRHAAIGAKKLKIYSNPGSATNLIAVDTGRTFADLAERDRCRDPYWRERARINFDPTLALRRRQNYRFQRDTFG